ncbi:hypothetical protein [Zhaonella formicivorans]|uniref:hypothetical protein n=1 Tax=Zhaonella formicivorans TaxID=2528593 RepID=UPI0010CF01B4|nr:hypothetical protein [Zhaonella formicivorans]
MTNDNKSVKKGLGFEYQVSGMFQSQGYLTRRGIPLQYGVSNHDVTDIDVLGIIFTNPFQGHRIICDCKNKARSKPYERIFWAKGLGEFVKANNVFVALNKTQWEIIRFASTGGVKVLTSEILEEYKDKRYSIGLADGDFYSEYESKLQKVAKSNSYINSILSNTRKLYLHENPYVAVNICLEFLKSVARGLDHAGNHNNDHRDTLKFLACELTILVGLQILWICSDVLGLPGGARRNHITSKLTYGDLDPKTANDLISTVKDLANEIIRSSVPKSVAPKSIDLGSIDPPPYTDSLIGLIERALARPNLYLTMPQHLDFLLFEQGLKGKEYSEEQLMNVFGYGLSDERFKVSRNILSFVRESCGLDWKSLWNKGEIQKQVSTNHVKPKEVIATREDIKPTKLKENDKADNRPQQVTTEDELSSLNKVGWTE